MSGREHGHDPAPHHTAQAVAAPPANEQPTDDLEVVPGFERENLQGWIPELATEADIRAVIEKAFDYRGDVTITRKNGSEFTGYLFDRRIGSTLADSHSPSDPGHQHRPPRHPLFRNRSHSLHRTRHRRRQKLRSLGKEVLGKASRRREEHLPRARSAGITE